MVGFSGRCWDWVGLVGCSSSATREYLGKRSSADKATSGASAMVGRGNCVLCMGFGGSWANMGRNLNEGGGGA